MIIFPAIDIRGGKCVRLQQGKFDKEQVFGNDPGSMASKWQNQGAKYLHIVDLDGALNGIRENNTAIENILKTVNIPIQLGGGIRNIEDISKVIELGVSRVIIGTSALAKKDFVKEALKIYKDKIAVSIDALKGYVAVDGWTTISDVKAIDIIKEFQDLGLKNLVYTDIEKDGMLSGPNFYQLEEVKKVFNHNIIASGGISNVEQLKTLESLGMYGAIIGKALYTGDIKLEDI